MIPLDIAIVIAAVCLVCEAFFSGSEIAVVSADRALLRRKAAEGNEGARIALDFLARPQRLLATTLIGTNVSVVTATTVMTLAILERTKEHGELYAVLILSPIFLIFAEVVPKTIFQQHANGLVTRIVYPLRAFSVVLAPAVYVVGRFTAFIARLLKVEERRAMVTRDELRLLLEDDSSASAIPEGERAMISNVLDLGDTTVYAVMVPLSEVTALPEDATLEEAAAEIADKQHTRIPIYRERVDQIIGLLFAFDVLAAEAGGNRSPTVADLARQPIYVPESKPTSDLLVELQRAGEQLAVVVDEYGGAVGICTIEDILEEIVGEIDDEHDKGPSTIRAEGPGLWRVQARTPIAKVNELLEIELPEGEDYESVAGLLLEQLKRIPKEGETIRIADATITILGTTDRAIEEVRIRVTRRR